MNIHSSTVLAAALLTCIFPGCDGTTDANDRHTANTAPKPADPGTTNASNASQPGESQRIDEIVAAWPERPRLGAREMIAKYGAPQEATTEKLVWHDQGPFKRIMVTREEIPHDFPKPHMDFIEHTIEHAVPADKTDELIAFDGSSTINRTAGELSARCDLEGHNILTLNLDQDILTGKKSVEQARVAFGEIVVLDVMGKHPPYVEALQFEPTGEAARFPDEPVIPGSPKRVRADVDPGETSDAEALAYVIALDDNEVLAAAEAAKKNASSAVTEYATMLHQHHGKNAGDTMMLGMKMGVTPLDTPAVDALRVAGAGKLAALIPLAGKEFGTAYLVAMVQDHTEALGLIDELLEATHSDALRQHLTATREKVAEHLEHAKGLTRGTM